MLYKIQIYFMKLSMLLETVQDQITALSNKYKISPEQVTGIVKSVSNDNWKFVLKLWYIDNIKLPEDGSRVRTAIEKFKKFKNQLENKDINRYKRLSDLEDALDKDEGITNSISSTKLGKVVNRYEEYTTIEVTNVEDLKNIGEGTKWCTRGSYPDCMAQYYLDKHGSIFVVLKEDKPFIQYTPDFSQIMDVKDNHFTDSTLLRNVIPKPDISYLANNIDAFENYFTKINKERWPEIEPLIVDQPQFAIFYIKKILNDFKSASPHRNRWPEAEPALAKDPKSAYDYAVFILRGPWPAAEPAMSRDIDMGYCYANYMATFGSGIFPEYEKNMLAALRRIHVEDREFRSYQSKMLIKYLDAYKTDCRNGSWPEYEKMIGRSR